MNNRQRQIAEGILFTDQYQLTMAQLYFRFGLHEKPAQFDHFFRSYPEYGLHKAGFCINAGLGSLLDWMQEARFSQENRPAALANRQHRRAPVPRRFPRLAAGKRQL